MMRFLLVWKTRSRTGEISFSEVVKPGTSALVESVRKRSTPSSPSRANARRSVMRPSSGSWSILKSPVCRTMPAPVRIATASASGIEWLTATNSRSNGPKLIRSPSATISCTVSLMRCSRSLEPISASVSWEPTSGMSRALAQQVGHGADVVLVAVGQHERVDVVEAVPDRVEVGQDQVDARVVLLGEEHPAVDDQQAPVVLEDGHVAADLAEAAERDHPQAALGQCRRGGQLGVGMAQRRRPASVRAVRTTSTRASSASTSGSRTARLSCTPSSSIAALAVITPGAWPMIASTTGTRSP